MSSHRPFIHLLIALLCGLCVLCGESRASDAVESFLERHSLYELLAVHLDERIETASREERDELILRLASVYATLLERQRDETKRSQIEERSRQLLRRAPPNTADELRLALLRASYLRAEEIAEQHRLRLASEREVDRAHNQLKEIVPELQRLISHYDSAIRGTNARLSSASGIESHTLYERLDQLERRRGSARFLLAWSLYYRQWLAGDTDTTAAERQFAEVLMADSARPQPTDISLDLRAFEPMARAVVGMALCKSLAATERGRSASHASTALSWLELLDDDQVHEGVRAEEPGWRLAILLEHEEYAEARKLLDAQREARGNLPMSWLRLAAVHALDPGRNEIAARALVQFAIAQLAAGEELQQILDLAERYGAEALGGDSGGGFAVRYVNGLITYREARDLHGEDGADRDELRELYGRAVTELEAALAESDASAHPEAAASCRRLVAWALYFQGEYLRASEVFERAATEAPAESARARDEAAEALWMAIVCLDRLTSRSERLEQRRLALIDRFLNEHSSHPRAATLLVNRAAQTESLSDDEISMLLSIRPSHESYYPARRRIAQALYQRFRSALSAGAAERAAAGEAFLGIAPALLDAPEAFGDPQDDSSRARRLVHLRRVLEVALHHDVADLRAAARAFNAAAEFESREPERIAQHRDELDYRRLQARLLSGDVGAAAAIAESMWERNGDGAGASSRDAIWARLAARAMFRHAHGQLRAGDASAEVLSMIVRHGGHVLREFDAEDPDAIRRPNALTYYATTAQASFKLWKNHDEEAEGRRALFVYRLLLRHHPSHAAFLRPAAILAAAPGIEDHELAVECWRRLSAGLATGSDEWFEARIGLITSLSMLDRARAREVMEQHRQLHPEYGPEPWGSRLRALDERLRDRDEEARG